MPTNASVDTSAGWVKYPNNPVLGGSYGICFDISVLHEAGAYRMWVSWRPEKSVALVESADGFSFAGPPKIVFGPAATGWEDDIILYDKSGTCYGRGSGLRIFSNGWEIAHAPTLTRLVASLIWTFPGSRRSPDIRSAERQPIS